MKRYWYLISHFECPVCGHEEVYRERVYYKPKHTQEIITDYDWCLE